MSLRPNPSANHPGRTYRWYPTPVLPFGYGLHYTRFTASLGTPVSTNNGSLLACNEPYPDLCPFADVPVTVTNTGNVTSDYVALLFVKGEYGPAPYPLKTLVGYTRLRGIRPGRTERAEIKLTVGSLARVDLSGNTVLYPGRYKLVLDVDGDHDDGTGGGSDGRREKSFDLAGEETILDRFPQPT